MRLTALEGRSASGGGSPGSFLLFVGFFAYTITNTAGYKSYVRKIMSSLWIVVDVVEFIVENVGNFVKFIVIVDRNEYLLSVFFGNFENNVFLT